MTTKIRVLQDFVDINPETGDFIHEDEYGKSVEPGTVVEGELNVEDGAVWYTHPETGEAWASPLGFYEVVDG